MQVAVLYNIVFDHKISYKNQRKFGIFFHFVIMKREIHNAETIAIF